MLEFITNIMSGWYTLVTTELLLVILLSVAFVVILYLILTLIKMMLPSDGIKIGRLVTGIIENIGGIVVLAVKLPKRMFVSIALAREGRKIVREEKIQKIAQQLVDQMPKVRVEIREIDSYTYCYDCDIHYNSKLLECPNCFARTLAEGDTKAIFAMLKGIREFRYLSFDREQDLIKLVSEKMVGDTVDNFDEKE